ncbi:hypothetical protein C0J52_26292 [Blattella germanica]|nr:hypothetical protein C0J52_26292 [Blattella germanica]
MISVGRHNAGFAQLPSAEFCSVRVNIFIPEHSGGFNSHLFNKTARENNWVTTMRDIAPASLTEMHNSAIGCSGNIRQLLGSSTLTIGFSSMCGLIAASESHMGAISSDGLIFLAMGLLVVFASPFSSDDSPCLVSLSRLEWGAMSVFCAVSLFVEEKVTEDFASAISQPIFGIFDRIEHKFLTSGHSFSSSDRDLALIEKRAKYSKIQTVEDVKTVIAVARPSTPYWVLDTSEKCLEERNRRPGYCACATSTERPLKLVIKQLPPTITEDELYRGLLRLNYPVQAVRQFTTKANDTQEARKLPIWIVTLENSPEGAALQQCTGLFNIKMIIEPYRPKPTVSGGVAIFIRNDIEHKVVDVNCHSRLKEEEETHPNRGSRGSAY